MPIRIEGMPYIIGCGLLALLLGRTRIKYVGLVPLLFTTWFFRDPVREVPAQPGTVLSPADGTVLEVSQTTEERVGPCTKVAIFMSVFNVHVNRAPLDGEVIDKIYKPGAFRVASLGKKTEANERMILYIKYPAGIVRVEQVAGLIARRIHCWPQKGDRLTKGERFGLIRFGSLLECYIPREVQVIARKGDKVYAGVTVLGRMPS